ncbi:class I SAM-dependent methyltransferase [Nocardia cyriacigeorgica]|uniref:class I SAM-dependent methyltransferase n=1 Tax=Nocardia cyriacigeorgica TaxID=135487 RepID=UPI001E6067F9|nr:class I SAM-dependent methyltransferase [Nocardia cyriacigeorgica]
MSSDVAREYADPSGLRTRIETHARYSARRDDPIADVLSALALNGTEDLADIGCGDGRFLVELAASGHTGQLVGADIATPMAVAAAAVPACHGVRADARRLPFAANAFDVLTARHLLHHVAQPLAALAEFRRITRPGGVVAVVVNHPRPYRSLMNLLARHGASPAEGTIVDGLPRRHCHLPLTDEGGSWLPGPARCDGSSARRRRQPDGRDAGRNHGARTAPSSAKVGPVFRGGTSGGATAGGGAGVRRLSGRTAARGGRHGPGVFGS